MGSEIEGNWDIVITSLQDICTSNESITFNSVYKNQNDLSKLNNLTSEEISKLQKEIIDHKSNLGTAKRLIDTSNDNLMKLIEIIQLQQQQQQKQKEEQAKLEENNKRSRDEADLDTKSTSKSNSQSSKNSKTTSGSGTGKGKKLKKIGRSFWQSKYNPSEPIVIGSEVAFKLRNRVNEWIQCEVVKIIGDGIKFEIRDPEPDENNHPGNTFKCNYKEILLIPSISDLDNLVNYSYGSKVLARYPDTTTYYPAIVVGNKKDGNVRLKFDGEEEVNKECEVERRLVLPLPQK
ncbi:uncharacterized protein KGF55_005058 [Candida pseudojiufengensis]|uniref:uncharacterized protein n=1 Tax=Candida pseudojiufengensis TaxID=497109 RepID=UPI002225AF9C|nr:uncharacterized protein KGF55_005058 [Candida pseudojiufengensis]KAI5959826.1 hypothetical protein KGF55_005058 [Candida pseudojiufengensis]